MMMRIKDTRIVVAGVTSIVVYDSTEAPGIRGMVVGETLPPRVRVGLGADAVFVACESIEEAREIAGQIDDAVEAYHAECDCDDEDTEEG
jgi:xanthosine utilization system XapX-like protein